MPVEGASREILSGSITDARIEPGASNDDSPTDLLDFTVSDGRTFDVLLENDGDSSMFSHARAAAGERAFIEISENGAALIATSNRQLSSQNDPSEGIIMSTIFTIFLRFLSIVCLVASGAIFLLAVSIAVPFSVPLVSIGPSMVAHLRLEYLI